MIRPLTGSVSPRTRPISGRNIAGRKEKAAFSLSASVLARDRRVRNSAYSLGNSSGMPLMLSTPPTTYTLP